MSAQYCSECGRDTTDRRGGAKTCSPACRSRRARRLQVGTVSPHDVETEVVYFIVGALPGVEGFVNNMVKIGKSVTGTADGRYRDHQASSPVELKLLRTVEGPPGFERALHRSLTAERCPEPWCGTEWFAISERVRSLIFELNDDQVRITAASAVLPEEWAAWLEQRTAP